MIKDWQEYNELESMYEEAKDRIIAGTGFSGIHFHLSHVLRMHGRTAMGRESSVLEMKKLLDEFVIAQLAEAE